jgi:hypothetical protein
MKNLTLGSYILLIISSILIIISMESCSKNNDIVTPNPIDTTKKDTNTTIIDSSKVLLSDSFKATSSGIFMGQGGYPVSGKVELGKNSINKNVVRLNPDFNTAIHTGSVTMYLSKNINLKLSDTNSHIKFGVVNTNGEHYLGLNATPDSTYKYVIVWCQSAGVQFGSATLK